MNSQTRSAMSSFAAVLTVSTSALNPAMAAECPAWVIPMMTMDRVHQLFAAPSRCTSPRCLTPVDGGETLHEPTYNFFARAKDPRVQSSIIGVQIKAVPITPRAPGSPLAKVVLARDPTDFACTNRAAYPRPDDPNALREISYEAYDWYHRHPHRTPSSTMYTKLHEQYHIAYKNFGAITESW